MKKLAVLFVCAAMLASCDGFKGGSKDLKAENDSLLMKYRKVSVRSMLLKAAWTYNAERLLKIQPAPNSRLLLTSNSSLNRWKKTRLRLLNCKLS